MNEKITILLIDHVPDDVGRVRNTLDKAGVSYELFVERDCESGLRTLEEQNFDCILVDYDLPMGDGLRFVRQSREKGIRTPIVIVNSEESEQLIIDMTKAGASNYLFKGLLTSLSLAQVLHNALRIHQLEQKTEEASFQLKETQERFHTIIRHAPYAIITFDEDLEILDWNPQAEFVFGYDEGDVLGMQALEKMFLGTYKEVIEKELKNYISSGKSNLINNKLETTACDKNLREFPVEITIVPTMLERRHIFIAFIRDLSFSKQQEELANNAAADLKRSNQELEQFAYVASHDLQEPLRMVNSYLSLIDQRYSRQLDKDGNEFIRFAMEGAKRMKGLIDDLLQFSRVNTQRTKIEDVNLNYIIENVINNLQEFIKDSRAVIEHGELPVIRADKAQMERLFQNLLSNAIKFRKPDEQPVVKIECKKLDGKWKFSVGDNGIGMKKENLSRIFVIFQRLHTRDKYEGTGIGLAICKKIVELHGGEINVKSEEGEGSSFIFTIKDKLKQPESKN